MMQDSLFGHSTILVLIEIVQQLQDAMEFCTDIHDLQMINDFSDTLTFLYHHHMVDIRGFE